MASASVGRLNNLFIHLPGRVEVDEQAVQPARNRTGTLSRATPGILVAVLVWLLVLVLSVGTNGALAAALAQHLTFPSGLVDAFSSLAGERDPQPEKDSTDLLVSSPAPEIYHFQDSGLPRLAGNGSALASSIVAYVPKSSPNHGGLLGLDFIHAVANNHSPYLDISAHPDAWNRGGVANRTGTTDPVRGSRDAVSDQRSDDGQAPASHDVAAPFASEPAIDSVPWADSTPNIGPARIPTVDEVVTLDDDHGTWAHPPTTLRDDELPPIEFVLDPRLGDDFAQPVAALAAARVSGPGTMGLLVGAFVAWPIAKRMRFGSARRSRAISSPSPRESQHEPPGGGGFRSNA